MGRSKGYSKELQCCHDFAAKVSIHYFPSRAGLRYCMKSSASKQRRGGGIGQWVGRGTEKLSAILTRVRVPGEVRDFSPRVHKLSKIYATFKNGMESNHV